MFQPGDKIVLTIAGDEYDMTFVRMHDGLVTAEDGRGSQVTVSEKSVRLAEKKEEAK